MNSALSTYLFVLALTSAVAPDHGALAGHRHRVIVSTDIGGTDPAAAEGIHPGARHVSRWREDFLRDFAARATLSIPGSPRVEMNRHSRTAPGVTSCNR
jgi:hypothetical protein